MTLIPVWRFIALMMSSLSLSLGVLKKSLPVGPPANKLRSRNESPSRTRILVLEGILLLARNLFAGGLWRRRSILGNLFFRSRLIYGAFVRVAAENAV